jgi:hypothetical protein
MVLTCNLFGRDDQSAGPPCDADNRSEGTQDATPVQPAVDTRARAGCGGFVGNNGLRVEQRQHGERSEYGRKAGHIPAAFDGAG